MTTDAYALPSALRDAPLPRAAGSAAVTDIMLDDLRSMRPWISFLAIMSFVGAGFMVLGGLGMLVSGQIVANLAEQAASPAMPTSAMGVAYLVMAPLYIIPGVLMFRMAKRIRTTIDFPGTQALEAVLAAKRSFWRFFGILTAVMLGLMVLGMVVGVVFGVMSAMP